MKKVHLYNISETEMKEKRPNKILKFAISQILKFGFLKFNNSEFQKFRNLRISKFQNSEIWKFETSEIKKISQFRNLKPYKFPSTYPSTLTYSLPDNWQSPMIGLMKTNSNLFLSSRNVLFSTNQTDEPDEPDGRTRTYEPDQKRTRNARSCVVKFFLIFNLFSL
ncbi:Protein CBG27016 [Caenorhabditis briggsae]|uniref:Protein CBG27016 n=1 Tax=Caenorhabditis briggsae TaxID=6238 RepID=B6IH72_CAEBR|nr:Protein CBG27016 [Caenorhabditis briggsae]CAR99252.1 Protein CBG27016 [Caenorhabditis briggsae]